MKPGDSQALAAYVNRKAPAYGLDPRAVMAVASQEGLSGNVGDNGTSYGPWQLHKGGAYPASAPQDPQAANAWAWSPAGIDVALADMSKVAGGQQGPQAVHSLVYGFERPSNPQAEYAAALRVYVSGALSSSGSPGTVGRIISDAANPVGAVVGGVGSVVGGVSGVTGFVSEVTSASFWLRALEVVGGGILLFVGVYLLARRVGLAPSVSGTASRAVQVAAVMPK